MIRTDYSDLYARLNRLRQINGLRYEKPQQANQRGEEEHIERMIPECIANFGANYSFGGKCTSDFSADFLTG